MPAGEVAVVGGGLIGLFSAHQLLERGYAVTVLEAGSGLGGGAARVNGGWVCPARSDPLPSWGVVRDGMRSLVSPGSGSFLLSARALPRVAGYLARFLASSGGRTFRRSWDELDLLNRRTAGLVDELVAAGVIDDLQDEGFLMLHPTREEAEASRASLLLVSRRGLCPAPEPILERRALLRLEPGLGDAAQFGFVHRGDRWLDPSRLVDRLGQSLRSRGVRVLEDTPVLAVRQRGTKVELSTRSGAVEAGHAVIAAGAWAEQLLRPLGIRGYVTPGKGYSFTIHPEHPPTHVLRLGETHVGVTPDGKPLIGCAPGAERVVVATGHNMLGLSLAAPTASLVADLVERGSAAAVPAFDPMRFTHRPR